MSMRHPPAWPSPQSPMPPLDAATVLESGLLCPAAVYLFVINEYDVGAVIAAARSFCIRLGATATFTAHVATAASELANNLWMHSSRGGQISLGALRSPRGMVVELASQDDGPGIADVPLALSEGFSTGGGLGCGLPGVQRLMDDFHLQSAAGSGTCIVARKWLGSGRP